ncbi:MAG: nitrogen regulation protein NR(I) [Gammaproteobacteria bacterium]|nr:nitrogen regulation protein NR(I) [Gammaproteobacteria bacterium]MBL7000271.1 nitrogen regulation protein NR(I) [Gammaproteobacteria bacterium]
MNDQQETTTCIWIIDDDQSIRWVLEKAMKKASYRVKTFDSASVALSSLKRKDASLPDTIISDVRMPGIDGFEFMNQVHHFDPDMPIIIMTAYSDLDTTVQAYQEGAFDYLSKPFDIKEALNLVKRAVQKRFETSPKASSGEISSEIIGDSPAIQDIFRVIGRLSRSHISVLINGESGTGKELVAQALHKHSPRANQPFIAINTAAIPSELLESELFGHEKGSFTGAQSLHKGRFEQANGGTLFLDEIGDMPMALQTRLLRVLAEGEFFRVGGITAIHADVRIIAATHQNLQELVAQGRFREDLYHRLNVIKIHLPALRDRKEDIPLLLNHFMQQSALELNEPTKSLQKDVVDYLCSLKWSGNVRQIENTCRWFSVMATGNTIQMSDLPEELKSSAIISGSSSSSGEKTLPEQLNWTDLLQEWAQHQLNTGKENILYKAQPLFEKTLLECALEKTGGRKIEAAKLLGWGRNTLTRKLKELYSEPAE